MKTPPSPVVLIGPDGRITDMNDVARSVFGDCVGRRCAEIMGQCDRGYTGCGENPEQWAPTDGFGPRGVCRRLQSHAIVELAAASTGGDHLEHLTPREAEVLRLVSEGLTNQRIARRLGIQFSTVRTHVEHARQKLGCTTRAEAVARALHLGWL